MEKVYSFKIGLGKGLLSLLAIVGALVAFAGFSDLTIWDLMVTYVKPVVGSLTIGGLITIAVNWIKFHTTDHSA